jgi:hypothetical protein
MPGNSRSQKQVCERIASAVENIQMAVCWPQKKDIELLLEGLA